MPLETPGLYTLDVNSLVGRWWEALCSVPSEKDTAAYRRLADGNAAVSCVNDSVCLATRLYNRNADTFGIWSDTSGTEFRAVTRTPGQP